jgi:hypothetical protein
MPTQEEVLRGLHKVIGPVRTARESLEGRINRNALNRALYSQKSEKTRHSRKMYYGGSHAKVANLFPMEAPMNRPHSERFGTARQFTKKAPRPNVNAAYRNKVANVLPTEESLIPGVIAAGQAVRSRLNRSYPRSKYYYNSKQAYNNIYKETYGGSRKRGTRRTHRTWKQTKRTQKHTSKNKTILLVLLSVLELF